MRKFLFGALVAMTTLSAQAQTADPVVMTINGKQVTRGEFEYSFRKNGSVEGAVEKKTVKEYVPMFINYKLKVEAAEAARLDTLSSFKKEFLTYRDMQLTPYMVDSAYIDSVAHVVFDNTLKQTGGKDLIRPAHILIRVPQSAKDAEVAKAKALADSLCNLIAGGADFADLAQRFSNEPGTARNGGLLPLIGPGALPKEYEEVVYALQVGETAKAPVKTEYGFFIIKLTERRPFKNFADWKEEIYEILKKQNIEEISAEAKIKKMVEASHGRLTRETVLDSVMNAHIEGNPSLRWLIQEYHDGLLLYEISKRDVWDVAAADSVGQEKWYKAHKKQYAWTEPRFKGYVIHAMNEDQLKKVTKLLKKAKDESWRDIVKEEFNKDTVRVSVSGPYLCKKGENSYVDHYVFGVDKPVKPYRRFKVSGVVGKKLKQPKSYRDVKAVLLPDFQSEKEKQWVEGLRQRFPFSVNEAEIDKIKD